MLRVVVLGAAAGGGVPQWNCGCPVCRAARGDHPELRSTQSRGDPIPVPMPSATCRLVMIRSVSPSRSRTTPEPLHCMPLGDEPVMTTFASSALRYGSGEVRISSGGGPPDASSRRGGPSGGGVPGRPR